MFLDIIYNKKMNLYRLSNEMSLKFAMLLKPLY